MNVETVLFQQSEWVPNNQRLPVLVYRAVMPDGGSSDFEETFARNSWIGIWRNGVFEYQHYHCGAHEVLGVGRGSATILIGGPTGKGFEVAAGDCLVLPAGTGHRKLASSHDFQVVGAYPPDQHADIQTDAATPALLETISSLALPKTDPLFGSSGDLLKAWR
jgi:uncharacterized protein YjlB